MNVLRQSGSVANDKVVGPPERLAIWVSCLSEEHNPLAVCRALYDLALMSQNMPPGYKPFCPRICYRALPGASSDKLIQENRFTLSGYPEASIRASSAKV